MDHRKKHECSLLDVKEKQSGFKSVLKLESDLQSILDPIERSRTEVRRFPDEVLANFDMIHK